MYGLVDRLARDCPSSALFASGGEIAVHEMQANVDQQRAMILLAGSGRPTDAVLKVREGHPTEDDRIRQIARYEKIIQYDIGQAPSGLAQCMAQWVQIGPDARHGDDR